MPQHVHQQCHACAELRTANVAMEEDMRETRRSSEAVIASLRQELEELLQNSVLLANVEQCPVYIELKAMKEDLERRLEGSRNIIHHLKEEIADLRQQLEKLFQRSAKLIDPDQCPKCAELEETKGALEKRVATLPDG